MAEPGVADLRVRVMSGCRDATEGARRRMRVRNPALDRPWSPPRRIPTLLEWQRCVPMPRHQPVPLGRLVEQRCAIRYRRLPEELGSYRQDSPIMRQVVNGGMTHQMASAGAAAEQLRCHDFPEKVRISLTLSTASRTR